MNSGLAPIPVRNSSEPSPARGFEAQGRGGDILYIGREGLTIIGWVAMWRPIEIFLYDWWPIDHRRRVYLSLGRAHIAVAESSNP